MRLLLVFVVCGFLSIPAVAQLEFTADAHTVLLMHFNELSGAAVADSSSSHLNGTAVGTTIVDGRIGKARSFNGSGDYISFGTTRIAGNAPGLTVEAWTKSGGLSSVGAALFARSQDTQKEISIELTPDGMIILNLNNLSGAGLGYATAAGVFKYDNRWHHVAVTYDSASGVKVYYDGLLVGSTSNKAGAVWNGDLPTTIGNKNGSVPAQYYQGAIDELRVSDIAQSPSEIASYVAKFSPTITGLSATSGVVGSTLTISGTGFDGSAPSGNVVFFGPVRGNVTAATDSTINVTVPAGAAFSPLTVLILQTRLSATSQASFSPTFSALRPLDINGYSAKVDFAAGNTPVGVGTGDLNLDGKPDLLVPNEGGNTVSILKNIASSGTITAASLVPRVTLTTASSPHRLAVADLNGDGKLDVAVTNSASASVSIYANIITGDSIATSSFTLKADSAAGALANAVTAADMDGDGRSDLLVPNYQGNTVSILRNLSSGPSIVFAFRANLIAGSGSNGIAVGDLDGDRRPDLVVTNQGAGTIWIFRNTSTPGTISFASPQSITVGTTPFEPALADIDGDGKLDIVVPNYGSGTVSLIRNVSIPDSIQTQARVDLTGFSQPSHVAVGELNGDGKADLVISNYGNATVSVLMNTATSGSFNLSTFGSPVVFSVGSAPLGVIVQDVNGDGAPDIVSSNYLGNSISVLQSLMNSPATGVSDQLSIPDKFELGQNYPNPFNPSTTIRYALPERSHVMLTVYNTLGQKVTELEDAEQEAGSYDVMFNANGLASGVYLYRIQAGSFVQARKLILVR